jgi:hypothetical protein
LSCIKDWLGIRLGSICVGYAYFPVNTEGNDISQRQVLNLAVDTPAGFTKT